VIAAKHFRAAHSGRLFFWLLALVAAGLGSWFLLRPPPRPNVLLITIDTLRADAINPRDTPALLDLAAKGTRWTGARTPVPLTLPAHTTILTGLEPPGHGIRDNTSAPLPDRAGRNFPLLAEEYRAAGYATAAFVASSVLDPRYGLKSGFDEYRHPPPPRPGVLEYDSLPAEEQVLRFRSWKAVRPSQKPYFAWIHLWEPHAPYAPYPGDARGRPGTVAADADAVRYAGEVRHADAAVEALLAQVDFDSTIVVICSDHGESLGEHGEKAHGYLCYGATLKVALILAGPGVPAGHRDARPCSLADIAPTLRRLSFLPPQPSDGRDLLGPPQPGRVVCSESLYAYRLYRWSQQSAAFNGSFSLVDTGHHLEIFDLARDPRERHPLADPTRSPVYPRLDRALTAYRARRPPGGGAPELAAAPLMYGSIRIASGDFLKRPADNRALRDPAKGLDDIALLDRARQAIALGGREACAGLVGSLEELERRDPGNPAPCLARGRALLKVLDRPAEAQAAFAEAVRRGYDAPGVLLLWAEACRRAGDERTLRAVEKRLKRAAPGKKRPR